MPYPNTALSAGQLAIIAVVAVVTLAVWISAVFLAARETAPRSLAAAGTPETPESAPPTATAGPEPAAAVKSGPATEPEPSAAGRKAA